MKMTIEGAIAMLIEQHRICFKNKYIRKPVAKALYEVWKVVDAKEKPRKPPKGVDYDAD